MAEGAKVAMTHPAYMVTFFEHPDLTGQQIHVYTWAAEDPDQAVTFARRQVGWLTSRTLYPSTEGGS